MGDAWSTAPGQKPIKPDVAAIIKQAQDSTEHAGDAGLSGEVALDGESLRHTDVGDSVGGGSGLGRAQLGSAALTAALTLHPCVHISGCGDASREVLQAMFSTVGSCSVQLLRDEESGVATGEASATFASAQAAEAAIRDFDGSRFDEGIMRVSVAKRAAQGSLTTRGKGGGRGGRRKGGGGLAFSERQRDLVNEHRLQQVHDEQQAFAHARQKQAEEAASTAAKRRVAATAATAAEAATAAAEGAAAKKRKLGTSSRLPGMVVVARAGAGPVASEPPSKPASQPPSTAPSGAASAGSAEASGGGAIANLDAPAEEDDAPGLLGLGGYGSSGDDDA